MSVESLAGLLEGGVGAIAVMGIVLSLMLTGKLHTDAEFDRLEAALDREKSAHDETRRALTIASERADAAVQASQLVASAFTEAQTRRRAARRET